MSTAKIIAAGCSAIVISFGCGVWLLAIGPIFNSLFPFLETNTPQYWFNFLGGGMISWLIPMIYTIIVLVAAGSVFGMIVAAFDVETYEN